MNPESFTVLVVCTGNLNRSALGAALLRTWAGWYLPESLAADVQVTSSGLAAAVGDPMRRRTLAVATALGAGGADHRAVQITEGGIRAADLVLVAEASQRDKVLGFVPGALKHTFTMREAGAIAARLPDAARPATLDDLRARVADISEHRALAGPETDVVDPQGKDDEAYREMARQEVPALARLAAVLFGMPAREVAAYDDAVADAAAFPFARDAAGGPATGSQDEPAADAGRARGRRRA